MKLLRSTLGYMIAGAIVMSVWGGVLDLANGTLGGILAGFFIIGLAWFLNHYIGLIQHGPNSGFVDLGLGVGMTGIFKDMWVKILTEDVGAGMAGLGETLPTLLLVVLGGLIGGYLAAKVEEDLEREKGGEQ